MLHLRSDYDTIQPWPTKRKHIFKVNGETHFDFYSGQTAVIEPIIPDDEPVFLLRGQDSHAGATIRYWAERQQADGADDDLIEEILAWAQRMDQWAAEHPHGPADVPVSAIIDANRNA